MDVKCEGIEKCGRCLAACPRSHYPRQKKKSLTGDAEILLITIDRSKCDNCGKCAGACLTGALYLCGTDYTVDEIMERIRIDVPFFRQSGGGITISGGECLCQYEFVREVLKRCKAESIHTAIDTSGYVPWKNIEAVLPYTDLFLYDLKNMNSELHKRVIGVPNERILKNAHKIAAAGGKFQIRIPVIPRFNDSVKAFKTAGEFILELGAAVEVVQLLPYHTLGTVKYERLQRTAPILKRSPSEKLVEERKNSWKIWG